MIYIHIYIWYISIYMIYICVSSHEMLSKTLRLNWLEYYALYLKLTSNWHAYEMIHIYIYTYLFIENIFRVTLYVQHICNISASPYRYQMNISQQHESTPWRNDEHKPWQGSKALSKTALGNKYIRHSLRHSVIHLSLSVTPSRFVFQKLRCWSKCSIMFYNVLIQHIQHLPKHFLPGFWSPKQATFWVVSSRSVHSDLDRHDSILVHICMHFPRANVLICNRLQTKHQSMRSSTWKQRPCGKFTYEFGIVWPWQNIVLLCSPQVLVWS